MSMNNAWKKLRKKELIFVFSETNKFTLLVGTTTHKREKYIPLLFQNVSLAYKGRLHSQALISPVIF